MEKQIKLKTFKKKSTQQLAVAQLYTVWFSMCPNHII